MRGVLRVLLETLVLWTNLFGWVSVIIVVVMILPNQEFLSAMIGTLIFLTVSHTGEICKWLEENYAS